MAISADQWADDVRLSDIEDRFVCKACGKRGADVRPDLSRVAKKRATVINLPMSLTSGVARRSCERRDQSCQVLLVATADPADRTVVALDRDGAASAAISAIVSVGAISGSIVVAVVTRLRAHSHAAEWSINANLSCRGCSGDRRGDSETSSRQHTSQ
jgi:hypothetical protein